LDKDQNQHHIKKGPDVFLMDCRGRLKSRHRLRATGKNIVHKVPCQQGRDQIESDSNQEQDEHEGGGGSVGFHQPEHLQEHRAPGNAPRAGVSTELQDQAALRASSGIDFVLRMNFDGIAMEVAIQQARDLLEQESPSVAEPDDVEILVAYPNLKQTRSDPRLYAILARFLV